MSGNSRATSDSMSTTLQLSAASKRVTDATTFPKLNCSSWNTGSSNYDQASFDFIDISESMCSDNKSVQEMAKRIHRPKGWHRPPRPGKSLKSVTSGQSSMLETECNTVTLCAHCNRRSANNSPKTITNLSCPYCKRKGGLSNWDRN